VVDSVGVLVHVVDVVQEDAVEVVDVVEAVERKIKKNGCP
jgi:hypothetical protein